MSTAVIVGILLILLAVIIGVVIAIRRRPQETGSSIEDRLAEYSERDTPVTLEELELSASFSERIVYPAPTVFPCCGDKTLRKIGEDVTETLELIPRQWKVIQHVREKFSCRACEAISQPPAPSHPITRGRAGPKLLAHILFAKFGLHLPLNRQSAVYAQEGGDLDVSTLADWVGAAAATLMPLVEAIRAAA